MKDFKSLVKKTNKVVIATDPDREGEAIAAHLASEVESEKVSRVQFTEITKEGIQEGMDSPHPINIDMEKARTT